MTSNKKLKVFSNTKNGVARCGWPDAYHGSGYLLNPRQQKTRYIAVTGFSYLKPGNVLLSHSKCYTIIG
ncbi:MULTISPECIES: hypothetical protein, partial [unclassified Pseudoalteromonas]|uniref:hypothetical protein n=1 Tax=unclassified Pseudoalteromonas TaxID=194690 RepID=UPI0023593245